MNLKCFNSHEHDPLQFNPSAPPNPADLKTMVDAAVAQGKWFNLVLHTMNDDDGAIVYSLSKDIWFATAGAVTKYIMQRDRCVITNYAKTSKTLQFDCYRLPIDASRVRSFETAITAQDTLTFQVNLAGISAVSWVTVNGTSTPFSSKSSGGNTNLLVNVPVTFNRQTVVLQLSNSAPVLPAQSNQTVTELSTLVVTNTAMDRDVPIQKLTYSLLNPPAGAQIDTNGVIQWTPSGSQGPGIYTLQTKVTDSYQPPLSATNAFTVAVRGLLTVSANNQSRGYGVTNPILTGTLVGVQAGDNITASYTTTASAGSPVGAYAIVPILNDPNGKLTNYVATTNNGTLTVTQAVLTVTATGVNKTYDATPSATVTLTDNRVPGDNLTASYASASFANKTVGNGKTVTVTGISISGPSASNYTLASTTTTTAANVSKATLTVIAAGVNRVYDGTTAATVTLADNRLSGDSLTTSYSSASFTNKNVGMGKAVSVTGISVMGTDSGNYQLASSTATTSASITDRPITVTAAADSKVYDGATNSVGVPTVTSGSLASGDTGSFTQSFNSRHVGTGKTLTPSGSINDGNGGNDYSVTLAPANTGTITARAITFTVGTDSKTYDGTTASSGVPTVTSGSLASGDTGNFIQNFDSKQVGTSKTLTPAGSINDGNGGNDYSMTLAAANTGTITARAITVTAVADSKNYDATSASSGVPTVTSGSLASGDTGSFTQNFADKNVGTGKLLSPAGAVNDGNGGANYSLTLASSPLGTITQRTLIVSAMAQNKVYDGTTAASVTLTDNRLAGDVFADDYANAAFADANVGTGKPVLVSGITLSGVDGGNYTVTNTASATADITLAAVTVTADDKSRAYGATNPVFTAQYSGFVRSEDAATVTGILSGSTTAQTNSPVGTYPISVWGQSAPNYTLEYVGGTLTVEPATLLVAADDASRGYGQTNPVFAATISGWVNGDGTNDLEGALVLTTPATADSPVGSYPIIPGGLTATNYSLAFSNGTLIAEPASALTNYTIISATGVSDGDDCGVDRDGGQPDPGLRCG